VPDKMDNLSPLLDRSTDPQPGIVFIMCTINITRAQMERVQLCRRLAAAEKVSHKVREVLWRLAIVVATDAEVDAGRGCPDVAPSPRQRAGPHHLPRLEERHDVVQ
jgi:hypothetical protein